eukprot:CAMPEP_0168350700 /NCGR_PEP_ID=MMETSP0213-20121227/21313_1 /TAXON_ID=151035 /ORGANISM="Euplotes harpa, Strain FSP1.4" /LENGTH=177 /DNA_ID=CAMNT_0008361173 /DNA_START=157 /DNA_END=691 /DNA_ORIENTATION=-
MSKVRRPRLADLHADAKQAAPGVIRLHEINGELRLSLPPLREARPLPHRGGLRTDACGHLRGERRRPDREGGVLQDPRDFGHADQNRAEDPSYDLVRRKTEFMQKYAKDSKGKHKGKGLQINQGNAPFFKYGPGFVHFFIIGSQGMKKTQDGTRTAKRITSYTQVMKKWMDLSTSRK